MVEHGDNTSCLEVTAEVYEAHQSQKNSIVKQTIVALDSNRPISSVLLNMNSIAIQSLLLLTKMINLLKLLS